jgi:hypothetical protein
VGVLLQEESNKYKVPAHADKMLTESTIAIVASVVGCFVVLVYIIFTVVAPKL